MAILHVGMYPGEALNDPDCACGSVGEDRQFPIEGVQGGRVQAYTPPTQCYTSSQARRSRRTSPQPLIHARLRHQYVPSAGLPPLNDKS